MRQNLARSVVVPATAFLLAATAGAQEIAEKEIAQANASVRNFKTPRTALVLSDGKVVVADPELEKLVSVDFSDGSVTELMKQGDKDDQFGGIRRIWMWRGDSIAAMDSARNRAWILSSSGGAARIMPLGGGGGRRGGGAGGFVGGRGGRGGGAGALRPRPMTPPMVPEYMLDGKHLFYSLTPPPPASPVRDGSAPPRSMWTVMRNSFEARKLDTVARFLPRQPNKTPVTIRNSASGVAAVTSIHDISEFIPADAWFVYRDGTVGVLRGADYHIDFFGPDDSRAKTQPIPFPAIKITNDEKKRSLDAFKKKEQEYVDRAYALKIDEGWTWPEIHPPFRHDVQPIVDQLDRVWVAVRCASTDKAECYDVIDRDGQRVVRLRLPEKTTLLAVGPTDLYTAYFEKSDRAVLQRHPLN